MQVEQIASEENSTDGNPYIRGIEAFNLNVQQLQRLGSASQVCRPQLACTASQCSTRMAASHQSAASISSASLVCTIQCRLPSCQASLTSSTTLLRAAALLGPHLLLWDCKTTITYCWWHPPGGS